jgi:hypothetical protein
MPDNFEHLQELEKEGYAYDGTNGFTHVPDPKIGSVHFVEMVKYGQEIKLEFDADHWARVKKYLHIN